jgi:hypothetical protein
MPPRRPSRSSRPRGPSRAALRGYPCAMTLRSPTARTCACARHVAAVPGRRSCTRTPSRTMRGSNGTPACSRSKTSTSRPVASTARRRGRASRRPARQEALATTRQPRPAREATARRAPAPCPTHRISEGHDPTRQPQSSPR